MRIRANIFCRVILINKNMIYFTADLHLGHEKIIEYSNRPFQTVGAMNSALISNWNIVVNPEDTVYIIGDLFFGGTRSPEEYKQILNQLSGKKYLVLGNHDNSWSKHFDLSSCFEDVALMMEINYNKKYTLTLCHYPMMSWKDDRNGSGYMIHGHIHNRKDDNFFSLIRANANMLNAGVDINGFRPVTFEELIKNNRRYKKPN